MKHWKYLTGSLVALSFTACTDKVLDRINTNLNDPKDVAVVNEISTVTTETAFGTTGTDMAWYASVFVEHNAGTYGQMLAADNRTAVNASSLMNNSWNAVYDNMMILNDIINKCSPGGKEQENKASLGIAQTLMAYNLAVTSDMWGQVPFKEALKGMGNFKPKYDKQQELYEKTIQPLLDSAIKNFARPTPDGVITALGNTDLIYHGDVEMWTMAAWSLKARYYLHMSTVQPAAVDKALEAVANGFADAGSEMLFNVYQATATGENPWFQFNSDRQYLSIGKTLYDIMTQRNDPRIAKYFVPKASGYVPAPNGTADETYSKYSVSRLSYPGSSEARIAATPLMTYHELKFIEAELKARKNEDFKPALQAAVEASFAYHKATGGAAYYTAQVVPLLGTTQAANLKEILTQKYIALYEAESLESYNDYRRTRIPALNNPNNNVASYGFVERFPYPTSETSANGANVPKVNIFRDKIWWAGGTE
ncbi:SusD/RagB family nutrient-binding outer membrane lipoprotein [Chitinophaga sp. Mgbs1]|uniref:SusD/RagB family nutrient-binding outer membrane lipoprotein n=1 Tax=Chitinophaga solisilvae TaxID=1233460 RepID=A0A433WJ70_9BACT|nr:SusD/RagB family nutrient-binding outer membrane lipoprotein [Chitinophaga solisilvae]